MEEWAADVVVDATWARRLIRSQVPSLAVETLESAGEGWDVTAWRVDHDWCFRFPRRAVVVDGLLRERAVLPRLAPHLPFAIPAAVFAGEPEDDYPYPFLGARFIEGAEPVGAGDELALDVARFLRELHAVEPAAVGGDLLPYDAVRRGDMQRRVPMTQRRFDQIAAAGIWTAPPEIRRIVADAEALPKPTRAHLAHGDLHLRQLLTLGGRLTGVIDWIDICLADPAIDLMAYWALAGEEARPAFVEAYGPIDEEQLLRARVLALFLWGTIALYGREEGLPVLEREAVAGLERAAIPRGGRA
jgi:aminoglycoside phosphotransferase (APT) family kinase protein